MPEKDEIISALQEYWNRRPKDWILTDKAPETGHWTDTPVSAQELRNAEMILGEGGHAVTAKVTPHGFITKDSGVREEYDSGMVRDTQEGKPNYALIDRVFLKRWAALMTRGAEKYGVDNWRCANSHAELFRFKSSAFRHLMQWLDSLETPEYLRAAGLTEDEIHDVFAEDHAAAVAFNLAAAETVRVKLEKNQ